MARVTKAMLAAQSNQVIGRWRVESVVDGSTRQVNVTCLECGRSAVRCIYELTRSRASVGQRCQQCANKQIIANNRLPQGEALMREQMHSYKKSARTRGFIWELSPEEFAELMRSNCFYCGQPPNRRVESAVDFIIVGGIDRVDSNAGYTSNNVRPACKDCNYAKRKMTEQEFFEMVGRVYEFHRGRYGA